MRRLLSCGSRGVVIHTQRREAVSRAVADSFAFAVPANPVSIKHRLLLNESLIVNKPKALFPLEAVVCFGLCN